MTESTQKTKWEHVCYQSGTQVVSRYGNFNGAHYHIGHLPHDTENDDGRGDVGKELANWINGGEEPWWLDLLHRKSADTVNTPHGCEIRATGPMVDLADPPSWGCWAEDKSKDAQIERGLMIEVLVKKALHLMPPR